jgi:excisionase family DNA binding protein
MNNSSPAVPRLYSIKELGALWSYSTKQIHRWVDDGLLPAHRLGGQIRISEQDAANFVRMRRK